MVSDKSFASVIHVNIALLRLSGVVPCENTRGTCGRNSQDVFSALAYCCLLAYSFVYTQEFLLHTVHLDTWMESFTMILSILGGQARFTLLLLFRNRLRRLLTICEQLWLTLSAAERKCVLHSVTPMKRLTYYYVSVCSFTILFYSVASFFVRAHGDSVNATATRTLPYACPLEVRQTPYYEIMYVLQLLSIMNVALTCVGTDTIGPVLILTICGHFKVLRSRILSLRDRVYAQRLRTISAISLEISHENASTNDEKFDLEPCVHYHQTVLEFCKEVEKLTAAMCLTQLLASTYNISLVGFKLAGDDPDKFKYSTQVSIAIIQLFLCNWPADVLLTESEAVARTIYFTPWYRFSYQLKKSLSIVTMRSQKPAQLTAGHLIPLSLQTFGSMMSSAASFFTMIRNMN